MPPIGLAPDSLLVDDVRASPNIEPRRAAASPWLLILHYTGMRSAAAAIELLASPASKVSCHYVVDEAGRITQMVAESMRAWHAGVSRWQGVDDINSASIGIEIHNPGHDLGMPAFPDVQMRAVVALCRDIVGRNRIAPKAVLAHSDIAPARKRDPGEYFDWALLARHGVGHWVAPAPLGPDQGLLADAHGPAVTHVQELLAAYGYGVSVTGVHDPQSVLVVTAFQRHFRPARVDGRIDRSTIATLECLLKGPEAAA